MQMFHNAEFLKCEFSQSDTGQLSVQYYLRHAQEEPEMYPPIFQIDTTLPPDTQLQQLQAIPGGLSSMY